MFLLVADRIPPDVQETIGPGGAMNEEGAKIEAGAILRDDEMYRLRSAITVTRTRDKVQIRGSKRVGYVERVVEVDIAICIGT